MNLLIWPKAGLLYGLVVEEDPSLGNQIDLVGVDSFLLPNDLLDIIDALLRIEVSLVEPTCKQLDFQLHYNWVIT